MHCLWPFLSSATTAGKPTYSLWNKRVRFGPQLMFSSKPAAAFIQPEGYSALLSTAGQRGLSHSSPPHLIFPSLIPIQRDCRRLVMIVPGCAVLRKRLPSWLTRVINRTQLQKGRREHCKIKDMVRCASPRNCHLSRDIKSVFK